MIQKISDLFFSLVDSYMHAKYGKRKSHLLKQHPAVVAEIGAGYGANFRYLKRGTHIIAIEPKTELHGVLHRRARSFGMTIEIKPEGGESISLDDNSVDMVLSSLVLCSVDDPDKVLSEVNRILRPGGKFVYVEHVAADEHSWICKIQNLFHNPWEKFFDGCQLTRNTGENIKNAAFGKVEQNSFSQRTLFIPIIPHICGVATK